MAATASGLNLSDMSTSSHRATIRDAPHDVTLQAPDDAVFRIHWYWDELDRRSRLLTGREMDPELRQKTVGRLVPR
jgi:hypothetical protein